ncbi:MAG TPA: tetratricopeptide repeat protein [Anaeromyxobacter sp.]|nr:tetratricopeptide repeat protein [Anaeromyxobacter sp.]
MNRDLLVALRHAIESSPPTAEAHLRLGTALLDEGSPRAAEQELRAALALDPGCAGAWVNLGGILFSRWDFAGALEANRRAAEADPALALAHVNQGLAHLQLGEPERALEGFGRAIALEPANGAAYHHLAIALHALGRSLEAEVCAAYARELDYRPGRESFEALERARARGASDASPPQPAASTAAEGERHGTAQGR